MGTDTEPAESSPEPTKVDRAFDVLAHPLRRTVVTEVEPGATVAVDELADRVAARHDAVTAKRASVELVHAHLPRLEEAGVVDYDRTDEELSVTDAPTVRAALSAVRDGA